jgi:hypothetical protein
MAACVELAIRPRPITDASLVAHGLFGMASTLVAPPSGTPELSYRYSRVSKGRPIGQ